MTASELTKTREVDEFGNISYTVCAGERTVGRILKTCSGYQVERFPYYSYAFLSYAPVGSIKAGMAWLAKYAV